MASRKFGAAIQPIMIAAEGRLTEQQAISVYLRAKKLQSVPINKKNYAQEFKQATYQDAYLNPERYNQAWEHAERNGLI